MEDEYRSTDRSFFGRDVLLVAPDLPGCLLERSDAQGAVAIRITEVEAYSGELDPGSHSYRGRTARTSTLFGPPGHIYAYFSYGLHHAVNLVSGVEGQSRGCLVRAGEVVVGRDLARARREASRGGPVPDRELARGPGNVAQALGATLADNGADLFGRPQAGVLWRFLRPVSPARGVISGGRVGISGPGGEPVAFPWRFWIEHDPTVSAYRQGAQRARLPRSSPGPSSP